MRLNEWRAYEKTKWIRRCPVCGNKTRDRIGEDTIMVNYPLYCPKCKQETLINVQEMNMSVIRAPNAEPMNL
ncbi:MAG: cysteine-rich KTR domain-containing protein [Ruminococcus sp.]|nr:cysteine-rich KTR domain-containing protein [Ruminococcus sp.]